MSCTVEYLERAARRFDALAGSCLDEATAALWRSKARACRDALDVLDSSGYAAGCGD